MGAGVIALLAQVVLLGAAVPGPRACQALDYPGSTGQARIQAAINNTACSIVELSATGPDAGGVWAVTSDITLKSNLTIQGPLTGTKPTIQAQSGWTGAGMLKLDTITTVTIQRLILDGATYAANGVWAKGCTNLTVANNSVLSVLYLGVSLNSTPCTDVIVEDNTFTSNGLIGVRSDTTLNTDYHVRVTVRRNTTTGGDYGIALANCGTSAATACVIQQNTINSPAISALDFNRVHYGSMTRNIMNGSIWRGITVDDSTYTTIEGNNIPNASNGGILLANGAVPANQPWAVSHNTVTGNTVIGSTGTALYLGASSDTVNDVNDSNTFSNNTISGNTTACGKSAIYVTNAVYSGNGPQACNP